jgi:hypothetical protein
MASKTTSVLALSLCIPVVSRDDDTSDVMGFGWCLIARTETVRQLMTIRVVTRIIKREADPHHCIGDTKMLTKVQQEQQQNVDGGNNNKWQKWQHLLFHFVF